MAFFGLTHLGTQNYFQELSIRSQKNEVRSNRQLGYLALPPLTDNSHIRRAVVPADMQSAYGPGHQGSFVELTRLAMKHTRSPEGPVELYLRPVTTSHLYGWHHREHRKFWTYVKRRPLNQSEMTKFVDHMKQNDKEFILF